jgi:hypothetical protein
MRTGSARAMTGMIRITFDRDDDGTGELTVAARANGFAGVGSAWFSAEELATFASRLTTYPLSEPAPAIAGGYFGSERGVLSQEHVGISAYPLGRRGEIGVTVRLATPQRETDSPFSHHAVQLELLTTYEHLARFAEEFGALVRGEIAEAVLDEQAHG